MPHSSREDVIGHSLKAHKLWTQGYVSVHPLATNMRAREDDAWRRYLLIVGDGTTPICEQVSPFEVRVPDQILAPRGWTHADLARHVFPDIAAAARQSAQSNCPPELQQFWRERALLTATNAMVDEVNAHILQELSRTLL